MDDFFSELLSIATLVFAVSSMFSVGVRYTIQEIIGPLRNLRLVIGALLANFVLVPLLAYGITEFLSFGDNREIGLLVVASAAGAPFLIKLAQMAGASVAIATGLLVMLLLITIVYMPLVVPLIAPDADVSAASIATPLVKGNPVLLIKDGEVQQAGMREGSISRHDLEQARSAGGSQVDP